MSKEKLDHFIQEAISNIRDDRAITSNLLVELMKHMKTQGDHTHETLGMIASKYVETLQRSNEQLVKLSGIVQKNDKSSFEGLSENDKDDLFDIIKDDESEKEESGDEDK
jgi:hypothetical protein